MYCNNCGKQNPQNSKFCQHCGKKIKSIKKEDLEPNQDETRSKSIEMIDQNTKPYPYVVSGWKIFFLSVLTGGVYDIYWFYKQWKSISEIKNLKMNSFWLFITSLFAPITSYQLFKHIRAEVKEIDDSKTLNAGWQAFFYFFLGRMYLGFLTLLNVQDKINYYWEEKYPKRIIKSNFGVGNWIVVIISIIIIIFAFSEDTSTTDTDTTPYMDTSSYESSNFEETYEQNFMEGCNEDGSQYESCYCLLDYLRTNYSYSQRLKMDEEYDRTNVIPQEMYDAVDYCSGNGI